MFALLGKGGWGIWVRLEGDEGSLCTRPPHQTLSLYNVGIRQVGSGNSPLLVTEQLSCIQSGLFHWRFLDFKHHWLFHNGEFESKCLQLYFKIF